MYCVYLLASRKHGTLYVGVTNNLVRRVYEHNNGGAQFCFATWRTFTGLV